MTLVAVSCRVLGDSGSCRLEIAGWLQAGDSGVTIW